MRSAPSPRAISETKISETVCACPSASWGVDYLKYDYCHMQNETQPARYYYEKMRNALNATGRPIHFNICSWGAGDPHLWGRQVGNSWRTGRDVFAVWDERTARQELRLPALLQSIETAIEGQAKLNRYSGPGGCNWPRFEPRLYRLLADSAFALRCQSTTRTC